MAPKIKLYGLFSLTRRGYLRLQGVVAVVLLALLAWALWLRLSPPSLASWQFTPEAEDLARAVVRNFAWVVLLGLAVELVETMLVLRRFARQEALLTEQTAASPPGAGFGAPNG